MTPAEFKSARRALGLSARGMGAALGGTAGRTIRLWEAGDRKIPGPAEVAVTYMLQGVMDETLRRAIPEHLIGGDAEGRIDPEIVLRLHRPRFMAWVVERPARGLENIEVAPGEYLTVALWIDSPAGFDADDLLGRAAAALEIYTRDSEAP